jgi:RNA polymerase sigma-70 factor (ECF subfamily)
MSANTVAADSDREQRFLDVVRENEARLRRICRVYGRAAGTEEDLYQEILVQVWQSLDSFRGRSAAGTWLYRVALNTALGQRRRSAAQPGSVPAAPGRAEDAPEPRDLAPAADEALEAKERLERLYAAIERLDETDRALVMLYLDERSYREMAEILGISESHVGVKLHRIRKRMGEWLVEEET